MYPFVAAVAISLLLVAGWTVSDRGDRFVGGLALVVSMEAGPDRVR
jgi:hypothetical protein